MFRGPASTSWNCWSEWVEKSVIWEEARGASACVDVLLNGCLNYCRWKGKNIVWGK